MKIRTGFGYDVHQIEDGVEFWLGGIKLDYDKGAVGHSDADVLIHAICDALLGAANLRDIGYHFSDNDPALRGIDSKIILKNVIELLAEKGYSISNIDSTIVLEAPKVNMQINDMREVLAATMEIDIDDISIKATTSEKLGFIGNGEGIAAYAIVLISKA